ncbi:MAG: hypothetical protein ACR2PQ_08010 [Myxococcota bacterium]
MTRTKLSPQETRILGLRVGHHATAALSAAELRADVLAERFDLVRVKVQMDAHIDAGIPELEETGLPYFYGGGLLRYRRDYRARPYTRRYPVPGGLTFVPVAAGSDDAIAAMVRTCFAADPIGYYKTPFLRALFDKDAEVECLVEFHLRRDPPGRSRILVRSGSEDVGFIVMTETDGTLHTDLLGVLPTHQSRGLFNPMRDYIHLHASERGLKEEEGARYDNVVSQNVFTADGLEHFANEAIFHVTPFLDRSELDPFSAREDWESELAARVPLEEFAIARRWGSVSGPARVRVPIRAQDLVLAVAESESGQLAYAEYRRR